MESTLSLAKTDLEAEVGLFLGYGRGAEKGDSAWSDREAAVIAEVVSSGLRQFYFPPPLQQGGESYTWSFFKPVTTLTLATAASEFELPDDFGGFDGEVLSYAGEESSQGCPVQVWGEGAVAQAHAENRTQTGRPLMAAIRWKKGTTRTQGQRASLYLFPTSDQAYTLRFAYYILADALTGERPYAYGGMAHAETIRAACKMAAEESLDDTMGVWAAKFRERLAASISLDRRNKPQYLGYNADRSDAKHYRPRQREATVTYNGVTYD